MKKLHSGFTLIELMIVVAIIGILAAVAIPQYQNYVARAQVSEALSLASGAKTAVVEYYTTNGEWPSSNADIGLADPTDITGQYVRSVMIQGGTTPQGWISVFFKNQPDVNERISGGVMILDPTDNGGSISWVCINGSTPNISDYLPSVCKDCGPGKGC